MKLETDAQLKRTPLYVGTSVLFAVLSIAVVCAIVAFSGSQMLGFNDLRDKVDSPVYEVREVGRDVTGIGMLFFGLLWLLAPAFASTVAIVGSSTVLDFQSPKWRAGYRLFTLVLVLVAIWQLVPWIVTYSNVDRQIIPSRVVLFRWIHIAANTLVGLLLALGGPIEEKSKDANKALERKDYSSKGCFGKFYDYYDKNKECSRCTRDSSCRSSSSCFGKFYDFRDKGWCSNCTQKPSCMDSSH